MVQQSFCWERGSWLLYLNWIGFLLFCDCWYNASLCSRGAVGWSMVCDMGISWSYSLAF